jgi:ribosomal protein L34
MKVKTRTSSVKKRRQFGFLTRMKTHGGRRIIKNRRKRKIFGKESTKGGCYRTKV